MTIVVGSMKHACGRCSRFRNLEESFVWIDRFRKVARFIGSKAHNMFCGAMDSYSAGALDQENKLEFWSKRATGIARFGNRRDIAAFVEVFVAPAP